jgi:hypothetical protein
MPENQAIDLRNGDSLKTAVREIVNETPVLDIHTHLYPPNFRDLSLWGVDELVNYHYLIAELFRSSSVTPDEYWALSKRAQADLIWKTLFVENTPLSEACRGVVCVLTAFGLNPAAPDLSEARAFFEAQNPESHALRVMEIANVTDIVMTNDIFDPAEVAYWDQNLPAHPKFHAVLRMDPLLNDWSKAMETVVARGFDVSAQLDQSTITGIRKFLDSWIARFKPLYMAASQPPEIRYPENSARIQMLNEAILPACREHDLPISLMIGVHKRVNPILRDAGDSLGHADMSSVERMCLDHPHNRFLVSMLSRENQHELCVAARKFANLMPFGCWWFMNNPSIIAEITSERVEMLGSSFIPQHSDARILEQIIYKWSHSRRVIAEVLTANYHALMLDGWPLTVEQIRRDVHKMFQSNFRNWVKI